MKAPLGSTKALIDRARAGDRAVFGALIERFRDRLERLIRSRMGAHLQGRVEAADVLQETLLRALESLDRFECGDEESLLRWLGGIAEHLILKAAEKEKRRGVLRLDRDPPGSGPSPSRAARQAERFDRFQKAFESLSPEHREVIRLVRLEGLQLKETAARLGRSVDAVKQLLSRALKKLRANFGETESFSLPDGLLKGDGDGDERGP